MGPVPFKITIPQPAADQLENAIISATPEHRAAIISAAKVIERGLRWLPEGLGESRSPFWPLGELRVYTIGPLEVV